MQLSPFVGLATNTKCIKSKGFSDNYGKNNSDISDGVGIEEFMTKEEFGTKEEIGIEDLKSLEYLQGKYKESSVNQILKLLKCIV